MQRADRTTVCTGLFTTDEPAIAAALALRVSQGDPRAEEELVARYSRGLCSLLRRKIGDDDVADDLHQATFRRVLAHLRAGGLDNPSRLAGFIHATAKHLVMAHSRQPTRRHTEPAAAAVDSATRNRLTPSKATLRDDYAHIVCSVLDELRTQRDRELLRRYYVDEEDKRSICRVLGVAEAHFNRVNLRARERFRELL